MSTTGEPIELTLRDPDAGLALAVLPHAGMLITSLRHEGDELLGQRRGVGAYLAEGKTMGIPLLHPWANRIGVEQFAVAGVGVDLRGERPGLRRDPNGLPIHGLLAAHPDWVVLEHAEGELTARFDFGAHPELLESFPFPHTLDYRVQLAGSALTLELTVTATSDVPVPVAHGLHPYLLLPGVAREDWQVQLPARHHLALDAQGLPTGAGEEEGAWSGPLGTQAFDDAYDALPDGTHFVLRGGGRTLTTTFETGYPAGQVFAPPGDALICFEPMAAPTNALATGHGLRLVEPGASDVARVRIDVRRD